MDPGFGANDPEVIQVPRPVHFGKFTIPIQIEARPDSQAHVLLIMMQPH